MSSEKKTPTDRELLAEARDVIGHLWTCRRCGEGPTCDELDEPIARIDAALATPDPRDAEIASLREQIARLTREHESAEEAACMYSERSGGFARKLDAADEKIATLTKERDEARAAGAWHLHSAAGPMRLIEAERDRDALRERVVVLEAGLRSANAHLDAWAQEDSTENEVTAVQRARDAVFTTLFDASNRTLAEHDARVREEGRRAGLKEAANIALAEKMPESFGVLTDATDAAADIMAKTIADAILALAAPAKGGAK